MESVKYVGLDVHQSTISVAVLNAEGKVMMQSVIATKATAVLDLLQGLRGVLHLTFEEGTYSAWLYDVVVGRVARVVVCNPRKNALLKSGNKSDQIDARKLAELLRAGMLSPVYHGEQSTRTLQQLVASYTALTEDTGRAMRRIKALYRSQALGCAGKKPFGKRHRGAWVARLTHSGQQRRLGGEECKNHAAGKAGILAGLNWKPHPRVQNCFQEPRPDRQCDGRSVPRVLRNTSRQRDAAGHGAPDAGPQDGGHCPDSVEERRDVRSGTSEATSSLSAHHHESGSCNPDVRRLESCAHGFEGKYPRRDRRIRLMGQHMFPRQTQQNHTAAPDASLR